MPTVATVGVPRIAFAGLLNTALKVLLGSFMPSSVTNTLNALDRSPGANVSIPDVAV
jgi:hypothetical protein